MPYLHALTSSLQGQPVSFNESGMEWTARNWGARTYSVLHGTLCYQMPAPLLLDQHISPGSYVDPSL